MLTILSSKKKIFKCKDPDTKGETKAHRLWWLGHVKRMVSYRAAKGYLGQPSGCRPVERPSYRWWHVSEHRPARIGSRRLATSCTRPRRVATVISYRRPELILVPATIVNKLNKKMFWPLRRIYFWRSLFTKTRYQNLGKRNVLVSAKFQNKLLGTHVFENFETSWIVCARY